MELLKELIGIQINTTGAIFNIKMLALLPILSIQYWMCVRTIKSYLKRK